MEKLDKDLLDLIFERTEMIVLFLDKSFYVQYANREFKKILGSEVVNNKRLVDLVSTSFYEKVYPFLNEIKAGKILRRSFNFQRENQAGALWYDVSGQPILSASNQIEGLYMTALPIKNHQNYESHVEKMLQLQLIASKISSKLIASGNIESAIEEAMAMIGRFSSADRAYVFEFNEQEQTMTNTYEWCQEGVEPAIDALKDLPLDTFPWWVKKLNENEIIHIPNVSEMSEDAISEKKILESQAIKSCLVLPLVYKNQCQGFIGFDHTHQYSAWDDYDRSMLSIIGEIFSGAFNRISDEKQMSRYYQQLEATLVELKQKEAQLVQQEQMVAIGHLAAGIAHEMNNPLGYVMSNVNMMQGLLKEMATLPYVKVEKDRLVDEYVSDMTEFLEDIDEGVRRVSNIVKGLRFFAQSAEMDDYVYYNINEGIKNTLLVSLSQFKEEVQVEQKLAHVPSIFCKASAINQVLLNLVMNSMDAIHENIDSLEEPCIEIETGVEKDQIFCKISDNGVGIPESIKHRVFTPFFTTKPEGKGTGLGLSIAYDIIVNQHHGSIDILTGNTGGTTFKVSLPKSSK